MLSEQICSEKRLVTLSQRQSEWDYMICLLKIFGWLITNTEQIELR